MGLRGRLSRLERRATLSQPPQKRRAKLVLNWRSSYEISDLQRRKIHQESRSSTCGNEAHAKPATGDLSHQPWINLEGAGIIGIGGGTIRRPQS